MLKILKFLQLSQHLKGKKVATALNDGNLIHCLRKNGKKYLHSKVINLASRNFIKF